MVNLNKTSKIPRSCLLLLFLQQIFLFDAVKSNNSNIYHAVENLTIDCGASGSTRSELDGSRTWTGDNDSKDQFSLIEHENDSVPVNATPGNPSAGKVPYYTARLSRSEFTYSFRVTEGQKFIRLHFFPSSYGNFHRSNSLFSVQAGNFTLLKDFNSSAIADEFFREYCINVDSGQRLNITFLPNLTLPDCYAFINGIEVVSMPANLYYTKPGDEGSKLVGLGNTFKITNNMALEKVYRINVGGAQIPAEEDTGMYRHWDADGSYLERAYASSLPAVYGPDLTPKYRIIPNYLIRLHFCEIELSVTESNQMIFQIFIADKPAENRGNTCL